MRDLIVAATAVVMLGSSLVAVQSFASPVPAKLMLDDTHKHGEVEKHKLGRKEIGGYTVSVILLGEVEAGKHVDFDIKLVDAKTDPKALRVWVGVEDAKGSKKADATKGTATYTGEVDVPSTIPEKAKLWVEIETSSGVSKAAFDYDTHDHKH